MKIEEEEATKKRKEGTKKKKVKFGLQIIRKNSLWRKNRVHNKNQQQEEMKEELDVDEMQKLELEETGKN